MKRLITLSVMLIALATAAPALADPGQSTDQSAGTVQIGSVSLSPAASANAPANAQAPVCVASTCDDEAGAQESAGSSASATGANPSSSDSSPDGGQSADQSVGTAQVGSVSVDPAAAVSAPVNANAPICVLADCSSSSAGQQAGSAVASTESTGTSQAGAQTTDQSVGTAQVGSASVDPAAALSAPVNANAPICVLADCSSSSVGQQAGSAVASTQSSPSEAGAQTTDHSVGTAQVGSASVDPAAALSAPVNANAPVCALGRCSSTNGRQQVASAVASTESSGPSQAGPKSVEQSLLTAQVGSVDLDPALALAAPVNANAPVCVLSDCSSSGGGQQQGSTSTSAQGSGPSQIGSQSAVSSLGTVQIGSLGVDSAVAASAPVNADAPICVLADCTSSIPGQPGGGGPQGDGSGGGPGGAGGPGDGIPGIGGLPGGGGTTSVGGATFAGGAPPRPQESRPVGAGTSSGPSPVGRGPGSNAPGEQAPPISPEGESAQGAGQAVLGTGAGTSTTGTGASPAQAVVQEGQLPFAGLSLPIGIAIGIALLIAGATLRGLAAISEGRAA